MKKGLFSLFLLAISLGTFAQSDNVKPGSFGFNFGFFDFNTPAQIKATSLSQTLKGNGWHDIQNMNAGFSLQYAKGITSHIDWEAQYSGTFLNNFSSTATAKPISYFQSLDAYLNIKLLKEPSVVNPFLSGGIGGYNFANVWGLQAPVGVGLQFNLGDNVDLVTQAQYRFDLSNNSSDHLQYTLGVLVPFGHKAKPVVTPPPPPPPVVNYDNDGDGVPDSVDACPNVAGLAALHGCPDKDGDGIADKDDKCPDVPGLAKYQGCPIPDTDGDGINDELDKCPTVAGVAKYQGCPVPDTDGDGVNDEMDKCPNVPGPASNYGCPVIDTNVIKKVNYAAKNLYFATGKYVLLAKSFPALNVVANVLNGDKSLNADIAGYTDNTGTADKNQVLSEQRANAVRDYLVKKGVDPNRLTAKGYGIENPVADNKTEAGRAKNRRVEISLRNY
jgi:outer membrane protein OmpA-like peptidoglycan-associated protein